MNANQAVAHNNDTDNNEPYLSPQPSFLSPPPHLLSPPSHLPFPTIAAAAATTTAETTAASLERPRRRIGRPPGAKNKPKPVPYSILQPKPDQLPALATSSTYLLELTPNSDIVDSLTRFTRRHGITICVLSATGTVYNVTLKQPATTETVSFSGSFDIVSLSAYVTSTNANSTTPFDGFAVTLAGPRGQIIGGKLAGPLRCLGTVYIVATSFCNPSYVRLPPVDGEGEGQCCSSSPVVSNGDGGSGSSSGTHVRMYSSDSAEGICAPTPLAVRPPPHTN